jgi:flagellar hook-associated protein 3 FlgL
MPSSLTFYTNTIKEFNRIQNDLSNKQQLIGRDTKARTYQELGRDINVVQSLSFSIEKTNRYVDGINEGVRRLDDMYQNVRNIIEIANTFKSSLMLENSGAANVNDLDQASDTALRNIQSALNGKSGNIYIFSGSKTDIAPVDDLTLNSNYVGLVPTANYYNGDNFIHSVQANQTLTVEYGITAADEAFQNLIAGINAARDEEGQGANFNNASELIDTAIEQIIALQGDIGSKMSTLEQVKSQQESAKVILEQKLSDVNSPDIVELSIEISSLQATLQATFQTFANISQLKLSDYL